MSFKKNLRRTIEQKETVWISYIWFRVHYLAEHAPKSVEYQFTKLGGLIPRDPKEEIKIILKFFFVTWKRVFRKKQGALWKKRKRAKSLIFDFLCTGCQNMPPTSTNHQFTKFSQLTARDPSEGAKHFLHLLFLTQRPILRKIQGGLSNKEKPCECILFDTVCIGWQSMPQIYIYQFRSADWKRP